MNIMPGGFYGSAAGQRIESEASLLDSALDQYKADLVKVQQLQKAKARLSFKKDYILFFHLMNFMTMIIVYITDLSFLKLCAKALLEFLIYNFNPEEQIQMLAILSNSNNASSQSLRSDFEQRVVVWRKILGFQIAFINLLVLVDHLYNYQGASIPLLQISRPISLRNLSSDVHRWLNEETEYRISSYSNARNFNHGSVFIDFVGEMGNCSKVALTLLDLMIPLFQYVMFLAISPNTCGSNNSTEDNSNEIARLVPNKEDGYQGSVCAFYIDVYPKLRGTPDIH